MRLSMSLAQRALPPRVLTLLLSILFLVSPVKPAQAPQGTAFMYQGVLKQNGTTVNGSTDMVFHADAVRVPFRRCS